jgi:uncharacterized protein (DUF3084 family)
MFKWKLISGAGIGTIVIAAAFFLSSCSNKITEEQLKQLKDLRTQERDLTEQISKKMKEKSGLEDELRKRKSELGKCDEQRKFVKDLLDKWPNVWPE